MVIILSVLFVPFAGTSSASALTTTSGSLSSASLNTTVSNAYLNYTVFTNGTTTGNSGILDLWR